LHENEVSTGRENYSVCPNPCHWKYLVSEFLLQIGQDSLLKSG